MSIAVQDYDINSLVGDHVRIWPYVSHLFHPDDLFKIWRMMQDDNVIDKIFWSQVPFKESPTPEYGTFAAYMEKTLPLIVQDTEHDGGVVGLVWFDDIVTGHRASINIWYLRKSLHAARMEGTALVLRYGFEMHGWQHIYGVTPWKEAVRHGKALGFTVCGKSPQYALVRDVPHDLYMIHKSSEL